VAEDCGPWLALVLTKLNICILLLDGFS